jgi:hypothetical protein
VIPEAAGMLPQNKFENGPLPVMAQLKR